MYYPPATATFHAANRKSLIASIGGDPVIVIAGSSSVQRSNDIAHRFEQSASMWYLSGIDEADWIVMIDSATDVETLFAPKMSDVRQIFDGSLPHDIASLVSGITMIRPVSELDDALKKCITAQRDVYALAPQNELAEHTGFELNGAESELWQKLTSMTNPKDCRTDLNKLRAIKQPLEIERLRQAIGITTDTLIGIVTNLNDYEYEYQLEAAITAGFRSRGSNGHAYDPIVASGINACTLHYVTNNDALAPNLPILIDVGARYGGYCADITRTIMMPDQTNDRAQAVIQSVKRVHDAAVSSIKPGLSLATYHDQVIDVMGRELVSLGLIDDPTDTRAIHTYFPHAISHGLGIDVHDSMGGPSEFAAGMVLTVEPGIYIPQEQIGVRIENDILVTDDMHENLSAGLDDLL